MEKAFSMGFAGSSWKGPRRHDYRPDLLWLSLVPQNEITPLLFVGTRGVDVENESMRCEISVGTSRAQCPINAAVTGEVESGQKPDIPYPTPSIHKISQSV